MKAWINAHLFGCRWAGDTFSLVNSSFSKMDRGRRKKDLLEESGIKETKETIKV